MIVTGGSRGVGRAATRRLARLGYAVVVNYDVLVIGSGFGGSERRPGASGGRTR